MSLKSRVAMQYILPLLLAYIAIVTAFAAGEEPSLAVITKKTAPAAIFCLACQLLQDFLPRSWKEVIVFWRVKDRLPGHRAYTEVCDGDTRIPASYIDRIRRSENMDPGSQNAIWYRQYSSVSKEPQVAHENLRYIAWRDTSIVLFLLAVGAPLFGAFSIISWAQAGVLALGCCLCALASILCARNTAHSLVRNVVARCAVRS